MIMIILLSAISASLSAFESAVSKKFIIIAWVRLSSQLTQFARFRMFFFITIES